MPDNYPTEWWESVTDRQGRRIEVGMRIVVARGGDLREGEVLRFTKSSMVCFDGESRFFVNKTGATHTKYRELVKSRSWSYWTTKYRPNEKPQFQNVLVLNGR